MSHVSRATSAGCTTHLLLSHFNAMDDYPILFDTSYTTLVSPGAGGISLSTDFPQRCSPAAVSDVFPRSPPVPLFPIDNGSDYSFSDSGPIATRSTTPATPVDSWSSTGHTISSHSSSRLQPDLQQLRKLEILCQQLKNENLVLHTENSTLK